MGGDPSFPFPSGAAPFPKVCVEMTHDARGRGMQPRAGAWDLLPVAHRGHMRGSREYASAWLGWEDETLPTSSLIAFLHALHPLVREFCRAEQHNSLSLISFYVQIRTYNARVLLPFWKSLEYLLSPYHFGCVDEIAGVSSILHRKCQLPHSYHVADPNDQRLQPTQVQSSRCPQQISF
jgi:hypothetical protein